MHRIILLLALVVVIFCGISAIVTNVYIEPEKQEEFEPENLDLEVATEENMAEIVVKEWCDNDSTNLQKGGIYIEYKYDSDGICRSYVYEIE